MLDPTKPVSPEVAAARARLAFALKEQSAAANGADAMYQAAVQRVSAAAAELASVESK